MENKKPEPVPTVDPNAPLAIDKLTKSPDEIPIFDKNAPLKVEQVNQPPSDEDEPGAKSNKLLFMLGGLFLLVVVLATVAFLIFYLKSPSQKETTLIPSSVTPTASATPSFSRADWTLEVLNGTSTLGAAKRLADQLKALGFKIVKISNADKKTYTENKLLVTKSLIDQADQLIHDLKGTFKVASVSAELEDSTASARLILGKEQL